MTQFSVCQIDDSTAFHGSGWQLMVEALGSVSLDRSLQSDAMLILNNI